MSRQMMGRDGQGGRELDGIEPLRQEPGSPLEGKADSLLGLGRP